MRGVRFFRADHLSIFIMPSPLFTCSECGREWSEDNPPSKLRCPRCRATVDSDPIGEEVQMRGKELYLNCEGIDDMVEATETRAERLRQLREDGFTVSDPLMLRDDYCRLVKYYGDNSE